MSSPRITYTVRTDSTTAEGELNALASVYKVVIDSARKRGRLSDKSDPDDAERRSDEIGAKASIP